MRYFMSCCASQLQEEPSQRSWGCCQQLCIQHSCLRVPHFAHASMALLQKHTEIQLSAKNCILFCAFSYSRFSSPAPQASTAAVSFVGIAFSLLIEFSEQCSFPYTS